MIAKVILNPYSNRWKAQTAAAESAARSQAYQDYRAGERDAETIAADYYARKALQDYRQGERAEVVTPSQPLPWWQQAGNWVQQKIVQPVQQAVPKVMNWVDQHQTEIVIGIGIAAGVAAVILSGGTAISCFNAMDVVSRYPSGRQFAKRTAQNACDFLWSVWQEQGIPDSQIPD